MQRALTIGRATTEVIREQMHRRVHPEESLRSSLGILRLARDFTPEALEQAATRALALKTYSYRALRALITTPPPADPDTTALPLSHENVRGGGYFQ